jgi:tetratricopeptide (TPR) repeat protein
MELLKKSNLLANMTSIDPWLAIVQKLSLSRSEKEIIKRYESDKEGRAFLPLADILRAHRFIDESIELLMEGVAKHPTFTVARVVLARELFHKGSIQESWKVLSDSPISLKENVLAQKIRFKLAVLLNDEADAKATYHHMRLKQMADTETKRLGDILENSGNAPAKERVLEELRQRGVEVSLPELEGDFQGSDLTISGIMRDKVTSDLAEAVSEEVANKLNSFHVTSLDDIFNPNDKSPAAPGSKEQIELDSVTLADIYARQGHYTKALGMFRRLLKMSSKNEYLRQRVVELAKLEQEQRDVDLTIDPNVVDRMESIEIIDRQIKYLNTLLTKLEHTAS